MRGYEKRIREKIGEKRKPGVISAETFFEQKTMAK
jgi:hypothetical protein